MVKRATHRIVLDSLRGFAVSWLPGDLVAGIMLAAIAIPEQLATAQLAGMPAQAGLYAFAAGSLAFAIFGINRYLSVGADSTIAPIFAGSLAAIAATNAGSYRALVGETAAFTGFALIAAGALRLGWIADLLSIPVTTGFLAGISTHIVLGQLPLVLGVPAGSGAPLVRLVAIVREMPHANPFTVVIGVAVFATTVAAERWNSRIPGALLGLALAGTAVAVWHLEAHGVAVLGALPLRLPRVAFALADVRAALQTVPVALIVALVCMVQTAVVLRSYPSNGEPEDPSRDFAAIGAGSVVSALFGAFAVDASPPRTAIAASSGGRSQLTGVVAVAAVALLGIFGAHLAAHLPLAALGGVLIFIGVRIFRVPDMLRIARLGGSEIWLVVAGALLVIVMPIEIGMLCAIVLSLVHGITIVARPPCVELFRVPGTSIWWPPSHASAGERVPGVLVFAPAAPITFTNGGYIGARLTATVEATASVRLLVIECSGVIDVDYTGARLLSPLLAKLRAGGMDVAVARLSDGRALRAAERTGLLATLGPGRVFDSVEEAIDACRIDRSRA
jgi:MFS superfamily sulfate permease-like transporter